MPKTIRISSDKIQDPFIVENVERYEVVPNAYINMYVPEGFIQISLVNQVYFLSVENKDAT